MLLCQHANMPSCFHANMPITTRLNFIQIFARWIGRRDGAGSAPVRPILGLRRRLVVREHLLRHRADGSRGEHEPENVKHFCLQS
jgi:hypothetical protein